MWVRHHSMASPRVVAGGDGLQTWRVAAKILKKQSQTADKGWSSSEGLTPPRRNRPACYEMLHRASEL
jgi:hypothetical protein